MILLAVREWWRVLRLIWWRLQGRALCCGSASPRGWHEFGCDVENPPRLSPWRGCSCGGDRETGYEHAVECPGHWPPAAWRHHKAALAGHAGEWRTQPPPEFFELPMGRRPALSWAFGELSRRYPKADHAWLWQVVLDADENERLLAEHQRRTPLCRCTPEERVRHGGCSCGVVAERDARAARRAE